MQKYGKFFLMFLITFKRNRGLNRRFFSLVLPFVSSLLPSSGIGFLFSIAIYCLNALSFFVMGFEVNGIMIIVMLLHHIMQATEIRLGPGFFCYTYHNYVKETYLLFISKL